MRFSRLLLALLITFSASAQTPIGFFGSVGKMIDYWASVNASTPLGDTWYFGGYAATSALTTFSSSWADNTGLPVLGVLNDGSAGSCGGGNIILVQMSKLPPVGTPPTNLNTAILPQNCLTEFGTNPGDEGAPLTSWGGKLTGTGTATDGTWKGGSMIIVGNRVFMSVYRQNSYGDIWGDSSMVASPDMGKTWIGTWNYNRFTASGATCSANVVTMTGTNTMAGSGSVYVHGVSPSGYNGMHAVTGATGSQITYSVASCPGAYVSGGKFGPMSVNGDAPLGPSNAAYPASVMWQVTGGANPMTTPAAIVWGQDGSFPTPLDSACDPANYICGYSTDLVKNRFGDHPMYLWRSQVGPDLFMLDTATYTGYTCSGQSNRFPSAETQCDVNAAGSWTATMASWTPVLIFNNSAGNLPRAMFAAKYSPTFKAYTMNGIAASSSLSMNYWMPHPNGPFYPVGGCQGGGGSTTAVPDGACGHDGGFPNSLPYGEVVLSSNPPSVQQRVASGGCCFHPDGSSPGNPILWNAQLQAGVLPPTGSARRYTSLFGGQTGMGYRFSAGQSAGAIPRSGPGYKLEWWADNYDHGGNTAATGTPYMKDVLTGGAKYFSVYTNNQGVNYNNVGGANLLSSGVQLLSASYDAQMFSNFTDAVVSANSGNASWTAIVAFNITNATGTGVQNQFGRPIPLFRTGAIGASTTGMEIEVGRVAAGDVSLSWGDYSGASAPVIYHTAGTAVAANTFYMLAVSAKKNNTGFPNVSMTLCGGGTCTDYGGGDLHASADGSTDNGLTKTCSSGGCSTTPAVTATVVTLGETINESMNGTLADAALYSGVVPVQAIRRIYQTMVSDWTRVGRGVLGSSLVISAAANTPTQAVLTYTAPNTSACTVEASENGDGSYRPLVNDVNTSLFTGSASDLRSEEITDGTTARVFVLGKHLSTYVAGDGHPYSRALQANTTHYVRVTCSGQVATTTVTTPVYPVGSSWSEAPPPPPYFDLDSTDRTRTIVDPSTGTLLKPLSLPHDFIYPFGNTMGSYMTNAGFNRMCGRNLVGPGPGLLCSFKDGSGSQGMLYYVIPSTGEVRFLGRINVSDWGKLDPADNKIYYNDGTNIMRAYFNDPTYTGVSSGATAALVTEVFMTGTPYTNAHAFNSAIPLFGSDNSGSMTVTDNGTDSDVVASSGTFYAGMVTNGIFLNGNYRVVKAYTDSTHIKVYGHTNDSGAWRLPTGFITSEGAYSVLVFNKNPNNQDGYASVAIVDMGDRLPAGSCSSCAHVIAASFYSSAPASRWCGCHNFEIIPDTAILNQEGHELVPQDATADMTKVQGHGYYYATLTATLTSGTNAVTVDGQPQAPGQPDSFLMNRAVGDYLKINGDIYTIASITDAQHFTISPNATTTYAIGSQVPMTCFAGWLSYWKFLADPTGQDATNTNVVITTGATWPFGGHDDWSAAGGLVSGNARVTEKWSAVVGKMDTNLGTAVNYTVPTAPSFAGIQPFQFGNATMSHLSFHQRYDVRAGQSSPTPQTWFMDELPFFGGDPGNFNPAATLVSGATNLRTFNQANGLRWNPKILPIVGVSKTTTLTDISGPTSCGSACMITDSSGDNGKFCIAQAAGECYAGSVAGDVFANVTGSTGVCIPSTTVQDLCIFSHPTYSQAAWQLGNLLGTPSKQGRPVTHCLSAYRRMGDYANFKSLDDGSWGMCQWQTTGLWTTGFGYSSQLTYGVFLAKLTPYVVPDAVDRTTFIRAPISITTPGGSGIATATVEFGYLENGTPAQHYCTQRKEACVAVASTVTDANPFNWKTVDTYTKAACASSCTIMLPVIPMRTAYWQVKFYDAGGAFVQNGQSGIVNESRVVILP